MLVSNEERATAAHNQEEVPNGTEAEMQCDEELELLLG